MNSWKPGDRVTLTLPDHRRRHSPDTLVTGTVTDVDPPGLPRGVHVALDEPINGINECFATHGELESTVEASRPAPFSGASDQPSALGLLNLSRPRG